MKIPFSAVEVVVLFVLQALCNGLHLFLKNKYGVSIFTEYTIWLPGATAFIALAWFNYWVFVNVSRPRHLTRLQNRKCAAAA